MKVEECIVVVERRSFGGCLDLAFVFAREFAGPLARLWLLCAVPSCLMVWLIAEVTTDLIYVSAVIFMFFSAVFNSLLVACMGPQVFGVPISVRQAIRTWRKRIFAWTFLTGLTRLIQFVAGFCIALPAVFVTAYAGHLPEVLILEQAPVGGVTPRLSWLCGGGGYSRNLARLLALTMYWIGLSAGLFLLMDLASATLWNLPIFFPKLASRTGDSDVLFEQLVYDDPAFHVTAQLALWLPYPVIRLTWFFCYLDQRIRNECWDLQLQYRAEAARLEELT